MYWIRKSVIAASIGAVGALGQEPGPAIRRLIQQAFERNREILAAQQRVAEARGLLRQAGVRPVPTLESNVGSGRPLGTSGEEEYSVGYFRPIETGGKRSSRIRVAEIAVELAEAELSGRMLQLAYDINTRCIEAAANRRKAEALGRIVTVNRDAYKLVDARVQRDDAAPLERQLLLVELNRIEGQRASAEGQAQAAELELRRTAGVGEFEAPEADRPPVVAQSLDDLRRRALELRPDLREARLLASLSDAELALAEAQSSPDLTLSAQYSRRHAQFEDPIRTTLSGSPLPLRERDNVVTLGISIPLQSRARNRGNIEAAAARQTAARLRREHLEAAIPLEVDAAWRRYQAARKTVGILSRGVLEESERNLSVIRQAYNLGQLRLLDVLNEQRRFVETELTSIEAEAELGRARAELERAAGGDLK